jgi:hypothetical protein
MSDAAAPRWAGNRNTAKHLGVTEMTLWRWKRNPKLNFPIASEVNGIERNDLNEVDAWLKARATSRIKEIEAA